MVEAIARIRFTWDPEFTKCRAAAYDSHEHLLGEVVVELADETRRRIWASRGGAAQYRIEEAAEKHLRSTLELRY
jgi:hypothetical protein